MNQSSQRILTTHAGSLPRPDELIDLNRARQAGEYAEKKAKSTSQGAINQDEVERQAADALRYFGDGHGENPYAIH